SGCARQNGYGRLTSASEVSPETSAVEVGRRAPMPHQPVRQDRLLHPTRLRQRTHEQRLRNADAEGTGDELVPHEPFVAIESAPCTEHHFPLSLRRQTLHPKQLP